MNRKWRIAFVSVGSIWPQLQISLCDGADVRVIVPSGPKKTVKPEDDFFGVMQHVNRLRLTDSNLGDLSIRIGRASLTEALSWCDFVYVDTSDISSNILAQIRKSGKPTIHGSAEMNRLEYDRKLGEFFLRCHGMDTTGSESIVVDPRDPVSIAECKDTFFNAPVLKSNYITMLPRSWDEFDSMMPVFKAEAIAVDKRGHGTFQLTAERNLKSEAVGEIAFASYFNGKEFLPYIFPNVEYKDAFDCPMPAMLTGESGTNLLVLKSNSLPHYYNLLNRFAPTLASMGYKGFFDLNCLLMKDGSLRVMEHTARPGYPTEAQIMAILKRESRAGRQSVADFYAWVAGLNDTIPSITPQMQTALSVQNILATTNVYPKLQKLPNVPVVYSRPEMDRLRIEYNLDALEVIPGDAGINEDGFPICYNFDRTALMLAAVNIDIEEFSYIIAVYDSLCSRIHQLDTALQSLADKVYAYGHIYSNKGSWKFSPNLLSYDRSNSYQPLTKDEIDRLPEGAARQSYAALLFNCPRKYTDLVWEYYHDNTSNH